MNRQYVSIILAITVVIAVASYLPRSVRGNGDVIEETRSIRNIDEISLHTQGTVFITIGNESSLRLEGESNILELIETDENGNELEIRTASRRNINPTQPINYYVTVETLEKLNLTASGDANISALSSDDKLDISVSGSGDVMIGDLTVQELDVRGTGSGSTTITTLSSEDVEISLSGSGGVIITNGEIDVLDLSITGSGDYDAPQVIIRDAEVRMTGSGDASMTVNEDLNANLSGSGNLLYAGIADVRQQTTGSGNVIQQDF